MNIYLLTIGDWFKFDYDSYDSFVVVAPNEESARTLIDTCGTECRHQRDRGLKCVWHDEGKTSCVLIGVAVKGRNAGILAQSFNAG